MVTIDVASLRLEDAFRLLSWGVVPRPIAWTSTRSLDGVENLAPFSYFTVASTKPAMLLLAIEPDEDGGIKDTLQNIIDTGEFVIHVPTEEQFQAVNSTADRMPPGIDEAAVLGLQRVPSVLVAPSRLPAAALAFECRLAKRLRPGHETLVIGEVLLAHIRDSTDPAMAPFTFSPWRPLARVGAGFARTTRIEHHLAT